MLATKYSTTPPPSSLVLSRYTASMKPLRRIKFIFYTSPLPSATRTFFLSTTSWFLQALYYIKKYVDLLIVLLDALEKLFIGILNSLTFYMAASTFH